MISNRVSAAVQNQMLVAFFEGAGKSGKGGD